MSNPLITVTVPIYKVEDKLRRCVDSILNQTYRNLEIILVDDGSPDGCPAICDEYALQDERVRVIHKQNAGLGFARNTGIENATGKYICFFDSDDYIESTTLEECCVLAEEVNADLVCFGNTRETEDGRLIEERIPTPPKFVFCGEEVKEQLLPMMLTHNAATGENWNMLPSACCGLFSMECIREYGWRFVSEREIISEDIYSMVEFYSYTNTIAFVPKAFYHYLANPTSLSRSYRADRYERMKVFYEKMNELSRKIELEQQLKERIQTVFLGITMGALKQIVAAGGTHKQRHKAFKTVVEDRYMKTVLKEYNYSGEGLLKRIFFWSMKKRCAVLSYYIIKIKLATEKI